MPILVMKEKPGGWITAHVMPEKGVHPYSVKRVNQTMKLLGHKKMIFRTDQEPSILAVKGRVKEEWTEDLVTEESPVGEHQSNGLVERAIQTISGQVKTMKISMEERHKGKIDQEHHIWPWVMMYAGMLINICHVHEDGRTAYEKKKGRKWKKCYQRSGSASFISNPNQ